MKLTRIVNEEWANHRATWGTMAFITLTRKYVRPSSVLYYTYTYIRTCMSCTNICMHITSFHLRYQRFLDFHTPSSVRACSHCPCIFCHCCCVCGMIMRIHTTRVTIKNFISHNSRQKRTLVWPRWVGVACITYTYNVIKMRIFLLKKKTNY